MPHSKLLALSASNERPEILAAGVQAKACRTEDLLLKARLELRKQFSAGCDPFALVRYERTAAVRVREHFPIAIKNAAVKAPANDAGPRIEDGHPDVASDAGVLVEVTRSS